MTAPVPGGSGPTIASKLEQLEFAELARKHSRRVSIGAGILVVLAAGVWLYVTSAQRKEAFASQALSQARAAAEAGNLPLAASDLARLIERFEGTRAASEAVVVLNQIRLLQGQRDVAVNALREFVRTRQRAYVKASAYALLGAALEDQGKPREAGGAYRQAAAEAELDFLKAQYLLDAGRALAAGADTAGAREAYREVLTRYSELDQAAEARVRMAEIGGEVPALPSNHTTRRGPERG